MKKVLTIILLLTPLFIYGQTAGIGLDVGPFVRQLDRTNGRDSIVFRSDLQYTQGTISNDIDSCGLFFLGTQLANSEIDLLLGDIADNGSTRGTLYVTGNNGHPTSSSLADRTTLETNNWSLFLNAEPTDTLYFTNTGQTFTEGVEMDTLFSVVDPGNSPDFRYVRWGTLPAGVSFNATDGYFYGTPTTAGTYNFGVVAYSTGDIYSGSEHTVLQIVVGVAASWERILINTGSEFREVINTEDPDNKYWNNLFVSDGTIVDLVDEDNNPTGVTIVCNWDDVSDANKGERPNDGVYPDDAWDSSFLVSGSDDVQTTVFSGLPSGYTYDITLGACDERNAGNRTGEYTIDSETLTLNAEINPPLTITFDDKPESSGVITLSANRLSGHLAVHQNFIEIVRNP